MNQADAAHALAHTVRMQGVLDRNPKHDRAGEYADSIVLYGAQWRRVPPATRQACVKHVEKLPGMSPATVKAAVAALEG